MRIAYLVSEFPKLSETFILNQITGLIDRGHEVDIFTNRLTREEKMHDDIEKYNLLDRCIEIGLPKKKLKRLGKAVKLLCLNANKYPIPLLRSLNIFKYGKEALTLKLLFYSIPFLEKNKYDIIHAHFGPQGKIAALLKEIGIVDSKIVTTFHGADMSTYIVENGNNTYDNLFIQGDLFLPISEYWKQKLIQLGCESSKIIVHRMGISTNKFVFKPRKMNEDGKIKILSVARLVEKKGIIYGIRAVEKVLMNYDKIEYNIIGNGPLMKDLEIEIKRNTNLINKVNLLGWKNQSEIIDYLNKTDILLAPSVTAKNGDQEGIPVAIMEAMAMGVPVISTIHSGIPELIKDGESGYLVPEKDVDALSEKILYLINHRNLLSRIGKQGREFIEKNYNIDKLNDQLEQIFFDLLKKN